MLNICEQLKHECVTINRS